MNGNVPRSQRYRTFVLMMLSGGFMGAYSYFLKGGVFANAETANLLILASNVANGDWSASIAVLLPILTFAVGSFLSEFMKDVLKDLWPLVMLVFDMALILVLAFLPESTPFSVYHVSIALISSMQFNTFTSSHGVALSTLFCTAHLRNWASSGYVAIRHSDKKALEKSLLHFGMIATFLLGAFLSSIMGRRFGSQTIIFSLIPLSFVFFWILSERD